MRILLAILVALVFWRGHAQQASTNNTAARFHAVDIYVDSENHPLAAYQIEFAVTNGSARIVGVEGGEHPAFAEPPFYDPQAMQHERVILAAFSTEAADKLPAGKTRVATIHVQTSGAVKAEFTVKLHTAAGLDGKKFQAEAALEERKAP